jgi:hypothetical protein
MNLSSYLAIAADLVVIPILVFAVTILHLRVHRLSTFMATVGVWVMLVGGLSNVFLIFRATWSKAYAYAEAAESMNLYFTTSTVVSYLGMAVFTAGLLWFAFQHPKPIKSTNAT